MTPLPKKKISKARKGKRQAAALYTWPKLIACENCSSLRMSHRACPTCGFYRGKKAIEAKESVKITKVTQDKEEKSNVLKVDKSPK